QHAKTRSASERLLETSDTMRRDCSDFATLISVSLAGVRLVHFQAVSDGLRPSIVLIHVRKHEREWSRGHVQTPFAHVPRAGCPCWRCEGVAPPAALCFLHCFLHQASSPVSSYGS